MKQTMMIFMLIALNVQMVNSQITSDTIRLSNQLNDCQNKLLDIENSIDILQKKSIKLFFQYQSMLNENMNLRMLCDSLHNKYTKLCKMQDDNRIITNQKINEVRKSIDASRNVMENRMLYGMIMIIGLAVIIVISTYWLIGWVKKSIIAEIRKQVKTPVTINSQGITSVDHSLALKVADEIVRIELNLSRMNSSIKGYKQLAKAVQRIKDNFQANGYEIVDMLGKPYNDGMKVIANFVSDENIEQGKQIITGVIKPQINYNGKMIQSAQITVSQNI